MQDSKEPLGTGTPYPSSTSDQEGHRGKSHQDRVYCISRLGSSSLLITVYSEAN